MRTPAQQAAARANGARSRGPKTEQGRRRCSMNATSLNLLASATALKDESRKSFQNVVRVHTQCLAPRNPAEQAAVEQICSAAWRLHRLQSIQRKLMILESTSRPTPDEFDCQRYALRALTGQDPIFHIFLQRRQTRLQDIIQGALDRIQALRQTGEKKEFAQTTPVEHSSDDAPATPAAEPNSAPEP